LRKLHRDRSLRITVARDDLTCLGKHLQSVLVVSSAFRGDQLEHAITSTELDERTLGRAFEAYRNGRRDIDPMLRDVAIPDEFEIVTCRRDEIVKDAAWYQSRFVREILLPLGMDHLLISEAGLPGGVIHRLAFSRTPGQDPFIAADRDQVHDFHRDLLERWQSTDQSSLPARSRAVLDTLLCEKRAKDVQSELGLSRATVDREIQTLYQHFGVDSRAGLMIAACDARPDQEATQQEVKQLSPRQKQVLSLLLTGMAEYDMAWVLGISCQTLHDHVKSIYRALGVCSKPKLMARYGGFRAQITNEGIRGANEGIRGIGTH